MRIAVPALTVVIFNILVWYHSLPDSIVRNRRLVFMFKFWFYLYHFLSIKWKLSTTFYPKTNGQTERQNNIIKIYFKVFVNYEKDNWARLFIAKFAHNNVKNAKMGYKFFELNFGYYLYVLYKKNLHFYFKFKAADELIEKLKNLIAICRKNLYLAQKLQKQSHDIRTKPRCYGVSEKVWLNSKYIKTKYNQKLEAKFF